MNEHYYCVILAGGRGRRLWPCSREEKPKQFLDFFGTGRTLLQQTFDRFAKLVPLNHIYVATNELYAHWVREQLPMLPDDNLLAEPIYRDTAPSVAWATYRIRRFDEEACVVVTPADQAVLDEEAFSRNLRDGFSLVSYRDVFLAMGVRPTRPEPGYGYIQLGEQVEEDVYEVQSFTEKPDRDFARLFIESEEFYWNTGIFMANVRCLRRCFDALLPPVLRLLDADCPIGRENEYVRENFPSYPHLSIDGAILERSEGVLVMRCDFGWADLGTWHSIYEMLQKSADDNVVIDSDVILEDARQNVIRLPHGRLAVVQGLEGFIVAEHGNVLLICRKEDSSALVRKFVNEVQLKRGDEFV